MQVLLNLLQAKCGFTLTVIYLKTGKTSTTIPYRPLMEEDIY